MSFAFAVRFVCKCGVCVGCEGLNRPHLADIPAQALRAEPLLMFRSISRNMGFLERFARTALLRQNTVDSRVSLR